MSTELAMLVGEKYTRQINRLSQNKLLCLPCSPFTASLLCPSLVILTLYLDDKMKQKISDVGFIIDSRVDVTTVWGQSWFIYDDKALRKNRKELRRGKIVVTMQSLESHGKCFEGIVTHVDYMLNLVVIKIKNPDCKKMPTAALASSSIPNPILDSYIFLDFFACLERFSVETYTFKVVADDERGPCENYLHVDSKIQAVPGVLLNSQLQIMGMKTTRCDMNNQLDHVLLMHDIYRSLCIHTQWSDLTDIPKNDINRSVLVPHETLMVIKQQILSLIECQQEKKWAYVHFWESSEDNISDVHLRYGDGVFLETEEEMDMVPEGGEPVHMKYLHKFYCLSAEFSEFGIDLPTRAYRSGNLIWLKSDGGPNCTRSSLLWLSNERTSGDSDHLGNVENFQHYTATKFEEAIKHGIQTLVFIPTKCGVIEMGSSKVYAEDWELVRNVKTLFGDELESKLVLNEINPEVVLQDPIPYPELIMLEVDVKIFGQCTMINVKCENINHPAVRLMEALKDLKFEVSEASVSTVGNMLLQKVVVRLPQGWQNEEMVKDVIVSRLM